MTQNISGAAYAAICLSLASLVVSGLTGYQVYLTSRLINDSKYDVMRGMMIGLVDLDRHTSRYFNRSTVIYSNHSAPFARTGQVSVVQPETSLMHSFINFNLSTSPFSSHSAPFARTGQVSVVQPTK